MSQKRKMKRGEILIEQTVFIILNIIFIAILVTFLFLKSGDTAVLEEKYAKQIALAIDSAQPIMKITLTMQDAMKKSDKYLDGNFDEVVKINENIVTVKLRSDSSYSYSFFNDVDAEAFPNRNPKNNEFTGEYIITINEK